MSFVPEVEQQQKRNVQKRKSQILSKTTNKTPAHCHADKKKKKHKYDWKMKCGGDQLSSVVSVRSFGQVNKTAFLTIDLVFSIVWFHCKQKTGLVGDFFF